MDLETRRRRCDRSLDPTEREVGADVDVEPSSPTGDAFNAAASSASARVAARSPAAENGDARGARETLFDPDAPSLPLRASRARSRDFDFSGVR